MNWQFYVFVFGTLFAVVGLTVGGFVIGHLIGGLMATAGIVGCVAWLTGLLYLARAMNSDI